MEFEEKNIKNVSFCSLLIGNKNNFEILHEIYPTNTFLTLKFSFGVNNCVFCETSIENLENLVFFDCVVVQPF